MKRLRNLTCITTSVLLAGCMFSCSDNNDDRQESESRSVQRATEYIEYRTESPEYNAPTTSPIENTYQEDVESSVKLCDLKMINDDYFTLRESLSDIDGNSYPEGNLYSTPSPIWEGGGQIGSAEFNLNKEFSFITATIAPRNDFRQDGAAFFEIVGDDRTIASYNISQKTEPFTINENVEGVKWLKLVIRGEDVQASSVIIYEPVLNR